MSKLTYRPDIDGLRGIAILSVIIYHFFPNLLTGGFVGVDIFFMIGPFKSEVILIHDIPTHANFCPTKHIQRRNFFMEKIGVKKEQKTKIMHISKQEILNNQKFRKNIEDIAKSTNVKLIDPFDYLCDENSCEIYATQHLFRYKDGSHLASSFVQKYVSYIDQTLI
tara:strand:- start:9814 stop:10311 length:498 start_codon:yes stop_codon:yes gene_type:complete